MPFVVDTTPPANALEELILDGLSLNDDLLWLLSLDVSPPPQRQEWIGAADSEHQTLVRDPLHENRTITARLQVAPTATMDGALNRIAGIVTKLQAASKDETGIELNWTPAGATFACTFDVLAGQVTELPVDRENGWFAKAPQITVVMTAKPYGHGTETLTSAVSSSTPVTTMEIANGVGDVPALGRLIVTDTATQSRRHMEWGLEGPLTYNPATSLFLHADACVTGGSGFAGARSTQTGAYNPNASANPVIYAPLFTVPVAVCGTGNLTHTGVFRVKARVYSNGMHRLTWQAADGPTTSNAWTASFDPPMWREIDLGTITIPAGSGKWSGTVEAYAPADSLYTTRINYLTFIPVTAGYGKARAVYSYTAGALSGYDYFVGTPVGGNLNGRTAPAGGSWVTSGSTTDFTFADLVIGSVLTNELVTRSTNGDTSPRYAILGSTVYTNTQVDVSIMMTAGPTAGTIRSGAIARWVDSSNYLRAYVSYASSGLRTFNLTQTIAGVDTDFPGVTLGSAFLPNDTYRVRLVVFDTGGYLAQLFTSDLVTVVATLQGTSSTLASGGALDDGKAGMFDYNTSSTGVSTREYDAFSITTPAAEPVVIYSGRTAEIRSDDTVRQDVTGTYTGRPSSYRGSRFLVPVGTSRVLAAARRNDIDAATSDNVTDSTQIQVAVTPRWLVVPHG